jgi:hypothetical protein
MSPCLKMSLLICLRSPTEAHFIWFRLLYIHAYSSTVHNSLSMESAPVPNNWWMDKENVAYTHNGVFFFIEEWNYAVCR